MLVFWFVSVVQAEPHDISNYREYSQGFASSGQPTTAQLKSISKSGVERVIYIAYADHKGALKDEDRIVKDLGMDYVHIPVDFGAPTLADFQIFAGVMQSSPDTRTLLHCQVNYRASAFAFLYRIIYMDVPAPEAINDLKGVWTPNEDWFRFLNTVADQYGLNINCDACDWDANESVG